MKLFDFMSDQALCGAEFLGPSWSTWRIIARLLDGDGACLTEAEQDIAREITGRRVLPDGPLDELTIGAGRRSGKTRFAALLAVHAAAQDYRSRMARGERAVIACIAPDRKQASTLFEYCRGLVDGSEILRAAVTREAAEVLEFEHGTALEVHTSSFRTVRGYTMALAIIDEAAFLRDEQSATPDIELARALRPALATLGGRLIVISSPHRKVGLLWQAYQRHFGEAA